MCCLDSQEHEKEREIKKQHLQVWSHPLFWQLGSHVVVLSCTERGTCKRRDGVKERTMSIMFVTSLTKVAADKKVLVRAGAKKVHLPHWFSHSCWFWSWFCPCHLCFLRISSVIFHMTHPNKHATVECMHLLFRYLYISTGVCVDLGSGVWLLVVTAAPGGIESRRSTPPEFLWEGTCLRVRIVYRCALAVSKPQDGGAKKGVAVVCKEIKGKSSSQLTFSSDGWVRHCDSSIFTCKWLFLCSLFGWFFYCSVLYCSTFILIEENRTKKIQSRCASLSVPPYITADQKSNPNVPRNFPEQSNTSPKKKASCSRSSNWNSEGSAML